MKLLILTALALLLGAFGSGFFVTGIVFNLGVLAGIEIAQWAKRRQGRIKAIGQIRVDLGGGGVDLTGTFLHYQGHSEFVGGGVKYFSYDQGATWATAVEQRDE